MTEPGSSNQQSLAKIARTHQIWGWWLLAVFVCLGLALETFHGLKLGFYLDELSREKTRRLVWTLAHAHGTLLALIQLLYSHTLRHYWRSVGLAKLCSFLFRAAAVLIPGGFFLGGVNPGETDPGVGIWLVPEGALFLAAAVFMSAWEVSSSP